MWYNKRLWRLLVCSHSAPQIRDPLGTYIDKRNRSLITSTFLLFFMFNFVASASISFIGHRSKVQISDGCNLYFSFFPFFIFKALVIVKIVWYGTFFHFFYSLCNCTEQKTIFFFFSSLLTGPGKRRALTTNHKTLQDHILK